MSYPMSLHTTPRDNNRPAPPQGEARYTVWLCTPHRWREFATLAEAERSARQLCRFHKRSVEIAGKGDGHNGERVATVRMDATGRVWTDLDAYGARLI